MIDGHLPSLDRLPIHRKLLESAVAYFQDDIRVLGLVVGGSLAHGAADFYSDVDLYIVLQDEGFDEIFAERGVSVEAVGSPLFGFDVDPMPGGSTDYIVIYEARSNSTSCTLKSPISSPPRIGSVASCSRI